MKRINNKLHKESFIVLQSFVDYFHNKNKKVECATVFYFLMYNLLNLCFRHAPNQKEIKKLFNLAFDEAKKNHTKH